jgi:hypothetical protein
LDQLLLIIEPLDALPVKEEMTRCKNEIGKKAQAEDARTPLNTSKAS